MNVMKVVIFALLFTFHSASVLALPTGDDEYVCDGCSDAQEKNLLYSKYGVGFHTAYVFDRDDEEVTKWRVAIVNENGELLKSASKRAVETSVTEGFSKYLVMLETFEVYFDPNPVIVPPSLYGSAYEVVGDPNAYNDLYLFTFSTLNWFEHGLNWAGLAIFDLWPPTSPILIYQFDDGSTFEAKPTDFNTSEMSFRLKYNYAEDAAGNVITENLGSFDPNEPVSGGSYIGTYIFNGGFTAIDLYGLQWTGGEPDQCYAISCASVTRVCNVYVINCL